MSLELLKTEITLYKADYKSFWQLHAPVLLQTIAPDGRPLSASPCSAHLPNLSATTSPYSAPP